MTKLFLLCGQFSCFQVVAVCPHLFPMSFAQCLVAIAADKSQEQDRLGRACLATMCELGWCSFINNFI